jgi:hypothetical protein
MINFISWGGMSESPLGTPATTGPIVPGPDDDERGMIISKVKGSTWRKTAALQLYPYKCHVT